MKDEASFGIIPLSKKEDEWFVLLILHKNGGHWAFPKGHGEVGESPLETAVRELKEETGLLVKKILHHVALKETYQFIRQSDLIQKTVMYFLAEVEGKIQLQTSEILEARWVKLSEAESYISFLEAKKIVQQALAITK